MKANHTLGLIVAAFVGATTYSVQALAVTLQVPNTFKRISIAMPQANTGDSILVSNYNGGFPDSAYADTFTVKSGVRVIAAEGQTPIVDGGSLKTYAVDFVSGASSTTLLEGITVRGGTGGAIRVRGSGAVQSCTVERLNAPLYYDGIRSDGTTGVHDCTVTLAGSSGHIGIYHTGGVPNITGCTIDVNDGEGMDVDTPSPSTTGLVSDCSISMGTGTGVSVSDGVFIVRDLTIQFDSSEETNVGISVGYNDDTHCTVKDCLVRIPGSSTTGVEIYSNNATVQNITVDNCGDGFYAHPAVNIDVHNCIVTDYAGVAFYRANAKYCIADGDDPFWFSDDWDTTDVNEEPRYCDEGNGDLTLRIDSYGNPGNNNSALLIGAFPVACAYDTLARNTVLVIGADATVWKDVIIPDGKSLTLEQGSTLRFDPNDESGRGQLLYYENEITVMDGGELEATGVGGTEVQFLSSESPGESWGGIAVVDGGTVNLQHAIFRNAYVGLWANGGGSFSVEHCDFNTTVTSVAIRVEADDLVEGLISNNTIAGGILANAPNLEILENTFDGADKAGPGIDISDSDAVVEITGNTMTGFDASAGVWVSDGRATLTENTLSDNKWGLHIEGDGNVVVGDSTDSDSDNMFTGNTRGLSCVWPHPSAAGALVRNNHFEENNIGAFVGRYSYGPYADLGSTTQGKNSFVDNDSLCIRNASNAPISAIGNWFGSYPATQCWSGSVIADDPLQSEPAGATVGVKRVAPRLGIQAIWPNPATAEATIDLAVESEAEAVVQVFDVAGRLLRTMKAEGNGEMRRVRWDGRDGQGVAVGSGMYFVRVKANGRPLGAGRLLVTR